jgi:hypothetical protein
VGADQAGRMIEVIGRRFKVNGHRAVLATGGIVIVRSKRVNGRSQLRKGDE